MNELIKVYSENKDKPTVRGRDLHEFLEVGTAYSDWFPRMCEYGFIEGIDFHSFLSESRGGRPATNHHLSLSMAKEISMLQRTDRGKQARLYFIKCEEKLKAVMQKPMSQLEILKGMLDEHIKTNARVEALEEKTDVLEAKAKVLESKIINRNENYFSVMGYCNLMGIDINFTESQNYGRRCSALSRLKGYSVDKVKDPRFGKVGSYHVNILKEIFCI